MYKSLIANQSTRDSKSRALVERRQQQRHDIHAAQRCISEEPDDSDGRALGPTADSGTAVAAATAVPLTKQQLYHLKFLAWRQEKRQRQSQQSASTKRAFTSTVSKNRFIGVKAAPASSAMPRSQHFQPPANLAALKLAAFGGTKRQTLNQPIVTRSMAAAAATAASAATSSSATSKPLPKSKPAKLGPPLPQPKAKAITDARAKARAAPKPSTRPLMAAPKPVAVARPKNARANRPPPTATTIGTIATTAAAVATVGKPKDGSASASSDSDTTAVGSAPFSIDGSMVTSTVQKLRATRGRTPDQLPDVFSPIEAATVGALAVRKSAQKHSLQVPQTTDNDANIVTIKTAADVDLNVTPIGERRDINYVSPYVSTSRGKVSARKERMKRDSVYKLDLNRSADDADNSPEVRQRREAALYFRQQVAGESERLSALAASWQAYKEAQAESLPECYADLIDVTTGQTRLLLAKKFQQFRGLVDQCEAGTGAQPVLAHDLEGFWSMVYMQVENCNSRFERLDALRALDWVEEADGVAAPAMVASRPPAEVQAATVAANKKRAKAKMAMRGGANPFLEQIKKASRQRLLEQQKQQPQQKTNAITTTVTDRRTPRKSMLASVLSHEAHKSHGASPRRGSPAAILSASTTLNKRTPPKPVGFTRSILKTPANKRPAGRGVVFAVTDGIDENGHLTPPQQQKQNRRSGGTLKFMCTPIARTAPDNSDDEDSDGGHQTEENGTPPQNTRSSGRQSMCVTPHRMVTVVQRAADRYSVLDSPVVDLGRLTLAEKPPPAAVKRRQHQQQKQKK